MIYELYINLDNKALIVVPMDQEAVDAFPERISLLRSQIRTLFIWHRLPIEQWKPYYLPAAGADIYWLEFINQPLPESELITVCDTFPAGDPHFLGSLDSLIIAVNPDGVTWLPRLCLFMHGRGHTFYLDDHKAIFNPHPRFFPDMMEIFFHHRNQIPVSIHQSTLV